MKYALFALVCWLIHWIHIHHLCDFILLCRLSVLKMRNALDQCATRPTEVERKTSRIMMSPDLRFYRKLVMCASWQDLKDHMRRAGDVCFAEATRDRDTIFSWQQCSTEQPSWMVHYF